MGRAVSWAGALDAPGRVEGSMSTAREPNRDATNDESFDQIGDRFIVANRSLRQSTRRQRMQSELYSVGDRELTPVQVDTLEMLATRPEWRVREVADGLGVDRSTASRTLNPLVETGLATRHTDPDDRRNVVVAVTATGRRTATTIRRRRQALMRAVLSKLSPDRRLLLTELLEEYVEALDGLDDLA
jgi:DNA-binding MarR family transcriptional regulator